MQGSSFRGHRVVTVATPWMTTQYSFCSHDQAFDGTMNFERFKGIFGTGGIIPAGLGKGWRNDPLVDLDGDGQQGDQ